MVQVLVVDDDEDIRQTLLTLLESAGHTVSLARDGNLALRILRNSPQRMVVLLDVNMPVMDGFAVLRSVHEDKELSKGHAYLLITAGQRTFPLTLISLLTDLHVSILTKPFDIDDVLDAVDMAALRIGLAHDDTNDGSA